MDAFEMYRISKNPPKHEDVKFLRTTEGDYVIPTEVWACGSCFSVHHLRDRAVAEQCCVCTYCGKPTEPKFPPAVYHQECLDNAINSSRLSREAKYEVVSPENIDWGNMAIFGSSDSYLYEAEDEAYDFFLEMREELEEGEILPEYWNIAEKEFWGGFSLDRVLEDADEFCEDGSDHLSGVEELDEALKDFKKLNADFYRWIEGNRRFKVEDFMKWYKAENPESES